MNRELINYIQNFMDRIGIPSEAKNELLRAEETILSNAEARELFSKSKSMIMNEQADFEKVLADIGRLNAVLDMSEYTLHFVFLINCTDILLQNYIKKNIDEKIFWDSMCDFRCKLLECKEVNGVWGTSTARWYNGFLKMQMFALGRFQYEESVFKGDNYRKNGIVLNKGDKVYSFHIPSTGVKLDKPNRFESYRKAYDFYGYSEKGGVIFLVCHSWLLHEGLRKILPPASNILDFMNDFDIISSTEQETFKDSWRVFGKYHNLPPEQLPKDTSLRKAIAEYLMSGGKLGTGYGVIAFDGSRIIN